MAVFRVEKTRDYTVMSNHHLKNRDISLKSKGLLSMILSLPDDWNYSTRGLAAICKEGVDSIGAALNELESAGYIVRNQLRDERGRMSDTEYVIYEQPQHKPDAARPGMAHPDAEAPHTDNPYTAKPCLENPAQLSTDISTTHPPITQRKNTQAANPYPSNPNPCHPSAYPMQAIAQGQPRMEMGLDEMRCAAAVHRKAIHHRIDYDVMVQDAHITQGRLDEIVDLMVETLCATNPTMTVAGIEVPTSLVQERLNRINSQHIQYVFHCLNKTTSSVRNIKKYLLAVLFNAPSTMDGYYAAVMNRDFGDVLLEDNYDFLSLANE